jgi:hypothetical protein
MLCSLQMCAGNPQMAAAMQNPQVRAMMSDPAFLRQLSNPQTIQVCMVNILKSAPEVIVLCIGVGDVAFDGFFPRDGNGRGYEPWSRFRIQPFWWKR